MRCLPCTREKFLITNFNQREFEKNRIKIAIWCTQINLSAPNCDFYPIFLKFALVKIGDQEFLPCTRETTHP